jgi:glutamate carboxypeptidase
VKSIESLQKQAAAMLDAVRSLVEIESPSSDLEATAACGKEVARLGAELLSLEPEWIVVDGRAHLRWQFEGPTKVLVLGHFDTVWPLGTTDRWPFSSDGEFATGPGIFDMKTGLVQGLYAVASLEDKSGIEILFNSDEEVGSESSKALIEEAAGRASAVLVLEPSEKAALKVARKGVATYEVKIKGRAAHAGLEPEKGVNALIEMAHQVIDVASLAKPDLGTTVSPTVSSSGTAGNTIPAEAQFHIDVRGKSMAELERVDATIKSLSAKTPSAEVQVEAKPIRPPLERSASASLFPIAQELAKTFGIEDLQGVEVGGGSDGNITANLGVPTLDGLGAVGEGAHAEGERIVIAEIPRRAALVSALIERLRGGEIYSEG